MSSFKLTEIQANAILEMRLSRLTGLERKKIEDEYLELLKLIEQLRSILANPKKILAIISDEAKRLKDKYGDERRTEIVADDGDITFEDTIEQKDMVITISHAGYIKRQEISAYRSQRRGGKGVIGARTKEEDYIEHLFVAGTHSYLLFLTDKGRCYWGFDAPCVSAYPRPASASWRRPPFRPSRTRGRTRWLIRPRIGSWRLQAKREP